MRVFPSRRFWLLVAAIAAVATTSTTLFLKTLASEGETVNPFAQVAQATSEQALAEHLRSINARMYGAYWCPYCHRQQELFGSAFSQIDYVECDARGDNARPQMCRDAGVQGYPTWEINGQFYSGLRSLDELSDLSGYQGSRNFSQSP